MFNIGDLILVKSTNPFTSQIHSLEAFPVMGVIVAIKDANPASHCNHFYKIHVCDEEDSDDRWLFSDELELIE